MQSGGGEWGDQPPCPRLQERRVEQYTGKRTERRAPRGQPCRSVPHICLLQGKNSTEKACCHPPPSAGLHMQAEAGPESQQDALPPSASSRLCAWTSLHTATCVRQRAGGVAVGRSSVLGPHNQAARRVACRAEDHAGQAAAPGPRESLQTPCPGLLSCQQGGGSKKGAFRRGHSPSRTCISSPLPALDMQGHSEILLCAGRESEQGALLRGRSRLRDLRDARERSGSGEVEMTEFERPHRGPLPRPSSTSQLQPGHAGARGGELVGSESTTGARPWGSVRRLATTARQARCGGMVHTAGPAAAAAGACRHVQR